MLLARLLFKLFIYSSITKAMLPTIALIGRPNVGKSTLFNRLIRQQKALTHDLPGVTRDRIYGVVRQSDVPFALVDTGGLVMDEDQNFEQEIMQQAQEAIAESQVIMLVVDGKNGLNPVDEQVARDLRESHKPVLLVVNKIDGYEKEGNATEFHALGMDMLNVSAAHGHNIPALLDRLNELLEKEGYDAETVKEDDEATGLRLALIGRPNAGKSSICNRMLGEDRMIVSDRAGTTRDSVDVTVEVDKKRYTFVDTAGIRRKSKISENLEHFSVLRSLKASKNAQVAVLVLDAVEGLTMQDKKLVSFLDREKTPLIIIVNKMDLIPKGKVDQLKKYFYDQLRICPHVPKLFTSALSGKNLRHLLPLAQKLWKECQIRVTTGILNRTLKDAITRHQPPIMKHRRAKFYYLTQAGITPPTFVFFVNDPELVRDSYVRYLENQLRKSFGLKMAPMAVHFRGSHKKKSKKG